MQFLGALLTGQVSRSQRTASVHRQVRDGYATLEEFKRAVEADERRIVEAQKNFAFFSGGQTGWLDLLRPLSSFKGFKKRESAGEDAAGPVTRWFRTNTFYRKPLVGERILGDGSDLASFLPALSSGVVFWLGPYSFVKLVEDSFYYDDEKLAFDYVKATNENVHRLKEKGYERVLFLEPSVGYDLSRKKFETPEWFSRVFSQWQGIEFGFHFPLADAKEALPLAEETRASFVGIDWLYTEEPEGIQTRKDLLLGIIDGTRAWVEEKQAVEKEARKFLEKARFSGRYYVGPNDRLFDVPFETALEKISVLSGFGGF